MLNEKWRRLMLPVGLLAFAALMCLTSVWGWLGAGDEPSPTFTLIAFGLINLTVIGLSAWAATSWSPASEGAWGIIFIASGLGLMLFLSVMFRTEPTVRLLFAFLSARHVFIMVCTHWEASRPQPILPSARLIK